MCGGPFYGLLMPMGCDMSHDSECEQAQPQTETAIEILKKRYARGEIRKEEFEQKKKDLV